MAKAAVSLSLSSDMRGLTNLGRTLSRRKTEDIDDGKPKLARVLSLFDLTLLGIGTTLGVGVYVLAGAVAKTDAGPAVILSFLVAAIASAFAGLCYAEFAARVPKAGSAYIYSYVSVGELAAFIIGWNLILEYVIGTASVARAFSNYIDTFTNDAMARTLNETLPLNISFLSPYPDFLSLLMILLLTALLAWGVKESVLMNNIFTALNLTTVSIVIIAGLTKVNPKNWNISISSITDPAIKSRAGAGGFMPFGVSGIMSGAARCFFGFVGFDSVATTGEEAKNPQRNIPLAIVFSLIVIFLAYFGIATVVTLMLPYYLQDIKAPLVAVFREVDMPVVSYIVSIGAVFALCTSLLGTIFPLPRIVYAMALDGLLPKVFARISKYTQTPLMATIVFGAIAGALFPLPRTLYAMSADGLLFSPLSFVNVKTKTPVIGTVVAGITAGIMASLFDLEQLIDMMSIGTLLAYTVVALCVLILRYRETEQSKPYPPSIKGSIVSRQLWNLDKQKLPTETSTSIVDWEVTAFCILSFITSFLIVFWEDDLSEGKLFTVITVLFFTVLTIFSVILIQFQPQDDPDIFFKVPLVPAVPCFSIFVNIYLMMKLDMNTWVRFIVWLFLGAIIYIFYSIPNSLEGKKSKSTQSKNNCHVTS